MCAFWKDTYQTVSKQEQPDRTLMNIMHNIA